MRTKSVERSISDTEKTGQRLRKALGTLGLIFFGTTFYLLYGYRKSRLAREKQG